MARPRTITEQRRHDTREGILSLSREELKAQIEKEGKVANIRIQRLEKANLQSSNAYRWAANQVGKNPALVKKGDSFRFSRATKDLTMGQLHQRLTELKMFNEANTTPTKIKASRKAGYNALKEKYGFNVSQEAFENIMGAVNLSDYKSQFGSERLFRQITNLSNAGVSAKDIKNAIESAQGKNLRQIEKNEERLIILQKEAKRANRGRRKSVGRRAKRRQKNKG